MSDTFSSLLDEREKIRDTLSAWWQRWDAVYRKELGEGDPSAAVYDIDKWARETPEEIKKRCGQGR